jgi:L-alanine-DL-glutamate epimerase-like enolase superfamily enzyme
MRIANAWLHLVRSPLTLSYGHSRAHWKHAEGVLLKLGLEGGESALGEAQPRSHVTGETAEGLFEQFRLIFPASLAGAEVATVADARGLLNSVAAALPGGEEGKGNALLGMLDAALLDGLAKEGACNVRELLAIPRRKAILPILPLGTDPTGWEPAMALGRQLGVREVKVRMSTDLTTALALIDRTRTVLGANIRVGVDANGSWSMAAAQELGKALREHGVAYLEQPLPVGQEELLPSLRATVGLPICLDESLRTLGDAERFQAEGLCDIYNLKIGKVGGLLRALDLANFANRKRLPCIMSTHVGQGALLELLGAILTASVETLFNYEDGYSRLFLREPPFTAARPLWSSEGVCYPDPEMGIGVVVDSQRLERWSTRREWFG